MADANILARYGIKEVADVTFYEIDNNGAPSNPVLYLDTLKVSTIEQTAEQTEARGGKGNPPLIIWDYGKEINVTLEDALFSAKSMAIMFGTGLTKAIEKGLIKKTLAKAQITDGKFELFGQMYNVPTNAVYYKYSTDGKIYSNSDTDVPEDVGTVSSTNFDYVTFELNGDTGITDANGKACAVTGATIEVSANTFPGTYYVTGDTYARSDITGDDEFFQFIIPKAKVQSENTLTLEAEGDPSVFNMSLRVMRPADGKMMKLVKYNFGPTAEAEEGTEG